MRSLFKGRKPQESTGVEIIKKFDDIDHFTSLVDKPSNFFVFKHSTRCSISTVAFQRVKLAAQETETPIYLIDVLKERALSNKVESYSKIEHQSPQLIYFDGGIATASASHLSISASFLNTHSEKKP